jgi:L-fuculose-phosphate aldolase
MKERVTKAEVVQFCRHLRDGGFICATQGNVSVKIGNEILITPSGVDKGRIDSGRLVRVSLDGKKILGGSPSSEILIHLEVYKKRKDVNAVIHSHPPISTALTLAGYDFSKPVLPEIVMTLGKIPTARYHTPGTKGLAEGISSLILRHDAILLERHGALTVGKTLEEAYWNLERVEYAGKVIFYAISIGKITPLSRKEVERLTKR